MSLSETVEETIEKLKPHHQEAQPAPAPSVQAEALQTNEASKSSFSMDDLKDYIVIIVCTAICLAAVFLLIIPQYEQISTVSSEYTSVQTELGELTKQGEYLQSLVGLKDELEKKIELAYQALPSNEEKVPYTLDQIVQIADKSGVSVDTLSLSGITDPEQGSADNLRTVMIQLSVTGPHDSIQAFIYSLEKARTIVDVSNFQISNQETSDTTTTDSGEIITTTTTQEEATMSLRAYLKPEAESENVDLSALANSPNYDKVIEKLNSMDFYETKPTDIEFGRPDPFGVGESTSSAQEENQTETNQTDNEDDDSSGFSN